MVVVVKCKVVKGDVVIEVVTMNLNWIYNWVVDLSIVNNSYIHGSYSKVKSYIKDSLRKCSFLVI